MANSLELFYSTGYTFVAVVIALVDIIVLINLICCTIDDFMPKYSLMKFEYFRINCVTENVGI